ncbi:MAG TPA: hypothetical protein VF221_03765 [Chloroflexota bacterium]
MSTRAPFALPGYPLSTFTDRPRGSPGRGKLLVYEDVETISTSPRIATLALHHAWYWWSGA